MKNYFLFISFIISIPLLKGQETGKFRLGGNLGITPYEQGNGINTNIDLRYNILDNFNIGMNFGNVNMFKYEFIINSNGFIKGNLIQFNSILLATDYYFNSGYSNFITFLGMSSGILNIGKTSIDNFIKIKDIGEQYTYTNKLGTVLRAGFEHKKFRLCIEYYLVPISTFENSYHQILKINDSFFSFTAGVYLGGGKWKKNSKYYIDSSTKTQHIDVY